MEIMKGTAATLITYAPKLGVPSSATVRYRTPNTSMAAEGSGSAATVDSVSGATNAAASEGDTTLSFASDPTAVPGRKYMLNVGGDSSLGVLVEKTGTTTTIAEPLPLDVSSGTSLLGIAITYALTTAETDIAGEGIARWTATVGGVELTWDQPFWVVKALSAYQLTPTVLTQMYPIVHEQRSPTDTDLTELIQGAWDGAVFPDLEANGIKVDRIKSWGRITPVHAAACVRHLIINDDSADPIYRDFWNQEYARSIETLFASRRFWYDEDDSLAALGEDPELQFSGIRLLR
jgi:hypothetical protein